MTNKELLELAAKAAGAEWVEEELAWLLDGSWWNPLTDDGDALRLAVKLGMSIDVLYGQARYSEAVERGSRRERCLERHADDPYAATRRAIVRAAAEIGKEMK